MNWRICFVLTLVIVAGHGSINNSDAVAGDDRLKEVEAAWHRREERTASGEFQWTVNRTMSHKPSSDGAFGSGEASQGAEAPILQTFVIRLVFNKVGLRYESTEPTWFFPESRFIERRKRSTFDGRFGKELIEQDISNVFKHQGIIISDDMHIRPNELLAPILRHYQPSRTWPTILDEATVVGDELLLNNRPCMLIRSKAVKRSDNIVTFNEVYVDRQQDFCIRRVLRKLGGTIIRQVDIVYRKEADDLVPSGWKEILYTADGAIERSLEATVSLVRLNATIDDKVFDLDFPPGTLVTDARDREKTHKFVVRQRGPDRPILPGELSRAKSAADIISSEPGFVPRDVPKSRWLLLVMGGVALVTLVAVLLRWKRRNNAS